MSKIILILLLSVVSHSALAGWTEIDNNDDFTVYADFSSIRKFNNTARMWSLYDYKAVPQSDGLAYMSARFQYEFDCQKNQARMRAFSLHAENMGGGEVVYSDSKIGKWEQVVPGSVNEARWQSICGNPGK